MTLSTGEMVAQVLLLASAPIMTRIYTVEDFGVYGVFSTLAMPLLIVACLSYDRAVPLPLRSRDGASVLWLGLASATFLSLITAGIVLFCRSEIAGLCGLPQVAPYLLLVPFLLLSGGASQALQGWALRRRRFSLIAAGRMGRGGAKVT